MKRAVGLADLVDGDDVRMVERGGGARLLLEAAHASRLLGELRRQHFERHLAAELGVLRQVDFAHPALPDQRKHVIMADLSAGDRLPPFSYPCAATSRAGALEEIAARLRAQPAAIPLRAAVPRRRRRLRPRKPSAFSRGSSSAA